MYKKKMTPKKDEKRKPMMYGSRTPMKKGIEVNNKIMYSMGGEVQKPN